MIILYKSKVELVRKHDLLKHEGEKLEALRDKLLKDFMCMKVSPLKNFTSH